MNYEERRAAPRHPCDIQAELQLVLPGETSSRTFVVRLIDISTLGAGVSLQANEASDMFTVLKESRLGRLKIKRDPRRFHIYCKVVWVDEASGQIGLWFTGDNRGLDEDPDFLALIDQMVY